MDKREMRVEERRERGERREEAGGEGGVCEREGERERKQEGERNMES